MATYHLTIKNGRKGSATEHSQYITRSGKYETPEDESDLVATSFGNLPDWANNQPLEFWKGADKHERQNGAAYRELEVALPIELTEAQQKELVERLIKDVIGKKPYEYGIHNPEAAIEGGEQPHAHIIYSDRLPDGIKRSPDQHFKRHQPKQPDKGGCKKDSGGQTPAAMRDKALTVRRTWADLQNETLAKYGHDVRVDHRSYAERGIKKEPGKHLGAGTIKKMKEPKSST